MKHQPFLAALLCGVALLSGCGSINSPTGLSAPGAAESQPLSELEQITQQVEAWEAAGAYDDETAYRDALLRTVELARAADQGAYRCDDPQELGEEKLEALASAANACNYAYSIFVDFDPFGEDLPETIAMLLIYMDDSPYTDVCYNLSGNESDVLPERNYYIVQEAELQPFLDRTLAPAAEAYRERKGEMTDWGWLVMEDGSIYVDATAMTATLPNGTPYFTGIEPLGGNRYLVQCDVIGIGNYPLAMVVGDLAEAGEEPQAVVLDAVSGERTWEDASEERAWGDSLSDLDHADVDRLRERYWVPGEGGQEAVELLARLEALSPVPYHTELAEDASPAVKQALTDAKVASEIASGDTFESYVQALSMQPTMYRPEFAAEDEWTPADPDHGYTYGDAWNVIPADELETAFQRRFGIDLTANDRAWMYDMDFILTDYYTGEPMFQFDGENYIVYLRGIGYVDFPYESSLTYHYDGTYTAVFTPTSSNWIGYGCPDLLRLRNVGTEEQPYFQLLGYELPA